MPGRQTTVSLVCATALTLGGCTGGERTPDEEMAGTVADAGRSAYDDSDLNNFLPDYVREHSVFADDDLQYQVAEGRVRVSGTVSNEAERQELERRIRRVPGVREVDLTGVRVGP